MTILDMQILNFIVLLDMLPPREAKFGATGVLGAIVFGLFISAIAVFVFLWFHKALSKRVRVWGIGIFIGPAIVGAAAIWAGAAIYDWSVEREWKDGRERNNRIRLSGNIQPPNSRP